MSLWSRFRIRDKGGIGRLMDDEVSLRLHLRFFSCPGDAPFFQSLTWKRLICESYIRRCYDAVGGFPNGR